jgi:hypothetical protein
MIWINPDHWKLAEKIRIVGEDIPPIKSVFDLKSGARAKLVDRSGSMVHRRSRRVPLRLDRMERGQSKDRGKVTPKWQAVPA